MSKDTIYREDAIKAINLRARIPHDVASAHYASMAINAIHSVPSADRPQGEWVKHDDERDYCSRCKHIFKTRTITQQDKWTRYIDDLGYNYCPNCGAKMFAKDINVPNKPQTDCPWK